MEGELVGAGLKNIALFEKDDELLFSWGFPGIDVQALKPKADDEAEDDSSEIAVLSMDFARSSLSNLEEKKDSWIYTKYGNSWFYCKSVDVDDIKEREGEGCKFIKSFCLIITSSDFNPEKYIAMLDVCCKAYNATGNVRRVLGIYLAVFTKGSFSSKEYGKINTAEYPQKQAYLNSSMKELVSTFGNEWVVLWIAALLKKRILVYGNEPKQVASIVRPNIWESIKPMMIGTALEKEDLESSTTWIAGTCTPAGYDYDVFVDLTATSIAINETCRGDLAVDSIDSEFNNTMVSLARKAEASERDLGKELARKYASFIDSLSSIGKEDEDGEVKVSLDDISSRTDLSDSTQRFLYNLAISEQMAAI